MTNLLDDIRFYYKQNCQLLKSICNGIHGLNFATLFHAASNYKSLNYKISNEKKGIKLTKCKWLKENRAHETPTKNVFRPTKYPREKIWDSRITREKFLTHEIPTGYTKLSQKHDDTMALHPREPR